MDKVLTIDYIKLTQQVVANLTILKNVLKNFYTYSTHVRFTAEHLIKLTPDFDSLVEMSQLSSTFITKPHVDVFTAIPAEHFQSLINDSAKLSEILAKSTMPHVIESKLGQSHIEALITTPYELIQFLKASPARGYNFINFSKMLNLYEQASAWQKDSINSLLPKSYLDDLRTLQDKNGQPAETMRMR